MGKPTATMRELSAIKVTNTNKPKVKEKAGSLTSHHSKNDSIRVKADTRELHIPYTMLNTFNMVHSGNKETIFSNHR